MMATSKEVFIGAFWHIIHFSSVHHNYFCAWQHVKKSDPNCLQSNNHPDLSNGEPPRTDSASVSTVLIREDSNIESKKAIRAKTSKV